LNVELKQDGSAIVLPSATNAPPRSSTPPGHEPVNLLVDSHGRIMRDCVGVTTAATSAACIACRKRAAANFYRGRWAKAISRPSHRSSMATALPAAKLREIDASSIAVGLGIQKIRLTVASRSCATTSTIGRSLGRH
jgi:hypothetical protein